MIPLRRRPWAIAPLLPSIWLRILRTRPSCTDHLPQKIDPMLQGLSVLSEYNQRMIGDALTLAMIATEHIRRRFFGIQNETDPPVLNSRIDPIEK